ncbi:MAG: GNAT family N-acetyltransferase [Gammaproteobacteria bacterium]|nr:GNAT family N-acetyltransferase [Gammaproteobacteria bacterium]
MEFEWQYITENIDWNELSELYRRAPLGDKSAQDLETVFKNSRYGCFVFHKTKLVAAGRCLADGVDCAYLCDIAVLPEYQGNGIGGDIIKKLLDDAMGHRKIILYAAPGKESLYKKYGFHTMNTAMAIFKYHDNALSIGLIS